MPEVKQMNGALSKREADAPDAARHASDCALEAWLSFLGHRWNALILWRLSLGPRSFSMMSAELSRITPKVLAERLAALADRGLVTRSQEAGFPRASAYELTPSGRELAARLAHFHQWAADNPLPPGNDRRA